jgi:hypothetical protein
MKQRFTGALAGGVLGWGATVATAGGATLTVTHDLDAARPAEIVSVPFAQIAAVMPEARMYHLVVRDPKGRALPSQITNYEHDHRGVKYDDLVFSYGFRKGEKRATFTLENAAATTPPEPPCVYARFVPERLDDMAWENDRIAHRMYGTALNTPAAGMERLRGSGIDVWGKRVAYPVIDRWYPKGHDQFHKDGEGEGLDLYSIGGSRGAGGTGIWDGTKLWTSDNFAGHEVLSNGPRRAAFRLTYAPFDAGAAGAATETKQFTIDCGRNFDAVTSTFRFNGGTATVALGLTEHAPVEGYPAAVLTKDPAGRWMSFWEENADGGLGVAVILENDAVPAGLAYEAPAKRPGYGNHLLLVKAQDGSPIRYYAGAGWTKSGQFADRAAWESYVQSFAARVAHPLTIAVAAQ